MAKEKNRYADAELEEFRAIIEKKLNEAKDDLLVLKGSLSHKDDHGTNDTSRSFNMMEDGAETPNERRKRSTSCKNRKIYHQPRARSNKIKNKTYGICRKTGKLINKDRLKLVPHATLSIEAKKAEN